MNESASAALKAARAKLAAIAEGEKDADAAKMILVGEFILDVVAAVLHQWEANKRS